jgi:hypothetical protein
MEQIQFLNQSLTHYCHSWDTFVGSRKELLLDGSNL